MMRCETDSKTGVSSNHSADLFFERHAGGDWIKFADFEDYKAGIKRNNSEGAVTKLGLEIVELRTRLQEMEKAGNRIARAVKRLARVDHDGEEGIDKLLKDWEDASNA